MELLIYFFAYLLTIWFIFFPKSINKKFFFIIWFFFSICLSLIIRSSIGSTPSADIDGYIANMQREEILSFSYYIREPIFWFGIRFLYILIFHSNWLRFSAEKMKTHICRNSKAHTKNK